MRGEVRCSKCLISNPYVPAFVGVIDDPKREEEIYFEHIGEKSYYFRRDYRGYMVCFAQVDGSYTGTPKSPDDIEALEEKGYQYSFFRYNRIIIRDCQEWAVRSRKPLIVSKCCERLARYPNGVYVECKAHEIPSTEEMSKSIKASRDRFYKGGFIYNIIEPSEIAGYDIILYDGVFFAWGLDPTLAAKYDIQISSLEIPPKIIL